MSILTRLDIKALTNLRMLCWHAGDLEGAESVTREILRRISMGQILPESIMCSAMNRHRPMSEGKARNWHKGRVATGKMKKAVEQAHRDQYRKTV